jgi:hypothetical protein
MIKKLFSFCLPTSFGRDVVSFHQKSLSILPEFGVAIFARASLSADFAHANFIADHFYGFLANHWLTTKNMHKMTIKALQTSLIIIFFKNKNTFAKIFFVHFVACKLEELPWELSFHPANVLFLNLPRANLLLHFPRFPAEKATTKAKDG